MRAALYARISLDRQDGEGVARQLDDCRALAASRGWEVAAEYVDNDVSAFAAVRRPEWDRLVSELDGFDVLVAYHTDRLYRRTRDLEDLIDAIEGHEVQVATVKAGDMDLATASGRYIARMFGAQARHEAERIGERVSRAKRERAAQGRPAGGGLRAFGYKADKVTIEPAEADLIRATAERVAAGGSLFSEVRAWNEAGWTTTAGNPWLVSSMRRVLTSPRIAGLRSYKGQVVGEASWPAIIDRETWDRIRAMTEGRVMRAPRSAWLLSGMIGCPHCGRVLYGSQSGNSRAYKCSPQGAVGRGCGRASISARVADAKVSKVVADLLAEGRPFVSDELGRGNVGAELEAIAQQRVKLAQRWAAGLLGDDAFDAATATLNDRAAVLDGLVTPSRVSMPDLVGPWERGTIARKREVIAALIHLPITLRPGRLSDPGDRLTVVPLSDIGENSYRE